MKIQGFKGTPIASIDLTGEKGNINAVAAMGPMKINADVQLERVNDGINNGLVAHIKTKSGAGADIVIDQADVAEIMAGMTGDVVKFALGALMKGKKK
ncbi:MAG: hypothetical protein ACOYIK_02280 [Coriobacteriales bacterium]|jgi:hypothetical protein